MPCLEGYVFAFEGMALLSPVDEALGRRRFASTRVGVPICGSIMHMRMGNREIQPGWWRGRGRAYKDPSAIEIIDDPYPILCTWIPRLNSLVFNYLPNDLCATSAQLQVRNVYIVIHSYIYTHWAYWCRILCLWVYQDVIVRTVHQMH